MHIIDLCMCAYDRLYTVQNHIAWNVFWTISLLDPIHRGMFAKPRWMQEIKPRSIGTVQWGCWIWMGDGNDGIIWNYMELYGIIPMDDHGWLVPLFPFHGLQHHVVPSIGPVLWYLALHDKTWMVSLVSLPLIDQLHLSKLGGHPQ